MKTCKIEGCENGGKLRRGWCEMHYWRWRRHGEPLGGGERFATPEEAFLARTEPIVGDPAHIIWTGSLDGGGYGQLWSGGRIVPAHRYSWEREHGPIPDGMLIDHTCHTPACVNPEHLRLATRSQNNAYLSGARKGRKHDLPRGVTRNRNGYQARVKINGRHVNAGSFPTIERAEIAVKNCRAFYFGEYAGN